MSDTKLTPIKTFYRGYIFHSRLEAKWAVFLDALNVQWEYEKEGYILKDGTWYLPDFWLPELDCWLEIKGERPTHEEKHKAYLLSSQSQKLVIIASGSIRYKIDEFWLYTQKPFNLEVYGGESWDDWESKIFPHGFRHHIDILNYYIIELDHYLEENSHSELYTSEDIQFIKKMRFDYINTIENRIKIQELKHKILCKIDPCFQIDKYGRRDNNLNLSIENNEIYLTDCEHYFEDLIFDENWNIIRAC
jgi:hypothetical protein